MTTITLIILLIIYIITIIIRDKKYARYELDLKSWEVTYEVMLNYKDTEIARQKRLKKHYHKLYKKCIIKKYSTLKKK